MKDILSLKKNKEFQRAYRVGKNFVSPILVTYVVRNKMNKVRIGITTSKKTGKAVLRNRSRRIIREAYRQLFESLSPGYDIVFVSRAKTCEMSSCDVYNIMSEHLLNANVLKVDKNWVIVCVLCDEDRILNAEKNFNSTY